MQHSSLTDGIDENPNDIRMTLKLNSVLHMTSAERSLLNFVKLATHRGLPAKGKKIDVRL